MKLEEKRTVAREQLAELLKRISAELEKGVVTIARREIPLPPQVELELEYKEKHGRRKIEIEVEWNAIENGSIQHSERANAIGCCKHMLTSAVPKVVGTIGSDVSILPQAVAGAKENPQGIVTSEQKIASVSQVPVGASIDFYYRSAPAILIHLQNGEFRAYAATCTHKGECVEWRENKLLCPKHNAVFDAVTGDALRGPAHEPLRRIEIKIEGEEIFAV